MSSRRRAGSPRKETSMQGPGIEGGGKGKREEKREMNPGWTPTQKEKPTPNVHERSLSSLQAKITARSDP